MANVSTACNILGVPVCLCEDLMGKHYCASPENYQKLQDKIGGNDDGALFYQGVPIKANPNLKTVLLLDEVGDTNGATKNANQETNS